MTSPTAVRGYLKVAAFPEDPAICPVLAVKAYLAKVGNPVFVFCIF